MTHWSDSAACRDRPDLADVWVGDDRRHQKRCYNTRARVCRHVSCGERYDRWQLCALHHGELFGGQRDRRAA